LQLPELYTTPLVSIGLPTFNGEKWIEETINCLLKQDYPNFHIIISDNASTDSTGKICKAFPDNYENIKYFRQDNNIGGSENFNFLIQKAHGKYFMFAGDHDLFDLSYISRCVKELEQNNNINLCYSKSHLIGEEGDFIEEMNDTIITTGMSPVRRYIYFLKNADRLNMLYGVIRLDVLKNIRGFKKIIGPDDAILAELSLKGAFYQINEPLFFRRRNRPDAKSKNEYLDRVMKDLDPQKNKKLNRAKLHRHLMYEHFAIISVSSLQVYKKIILYIFTFFRFDSHFGAYYHLFSPTGLIRDFKYLTKNMFVKYNSY
jgi:glycosyltransferase involved in cell wall biosynthesis